MADTPVPAPAAQQPTGPTLRSLAQYAKDISFENPNAPRSLQPRQDAPQINITVNVNGTPLADGQFQVELHLEGSARFGSEVAFAFDVTYGGVFLFENIPQDQHMPVMMIECPRLLFPFARQIVAEAVRNGGFPPLYIDPIDFVGLFQNVQAQQQAAAGTAPPAA